MKVLYLLVLALAVSVNDAQCQVEFRVSVDLAKELNARPGTSIKDLKDQLCSLISNYESTGEANFCKKLSQTVKKDSLATVDIFATSDYWESDGFKKYMRENSFSTAWISAYYKNEKIPLKDALSGNVGTEKQNLKVKKNWDKQNRVFKEEGVVFRIMLSISAELKTNSMSKSDFTKHLCGLLTSYSSLNLKFTKQSCNRLRDDINNLGDEEFLIVRQGYPEYWEIDKLKKHLRSEGIQSAFLVAFKDGKRTPIKDILLKDN